MITLPALMHVTLLQVSELSLQLEVQQASGSDAALLLRQELTAEQRARQEALGRLAGLEAQLAQVRWGGWRMALGRELGSDVVMLLCLENCLLPRELELYTVVGTVYRVCSQTPRLTCRSTTTGTHPSRLATHSGSARRSSCGPAFSSLRRSYWPPPAPTPFRGVIKPRRG